MTDVDLASAFFPGSHLVSDEEAGRKPLVRAVSEAHRAECVVCPAGSLVPIHPKVIHGGGRNVSQQSRRNFVVTGSGVCEIEKWLGLDNARSTG